MATITLNANWEDFKTPADFARWLELAKEYGHGLDEWWGDISACEQCTHLDAENCWCKLCGAPATRNPVLNILGMACCGAGYEYEPEQLALLP